MHIENVTLPAFLASALINGDTSGLNESDMRWLNAAYDYLGSWTVVSCEDESFFVGAYGTELPGFRLGCDALVYHCHAPDGVTP